MWLASKISIFGRYLAGSYPSSYGSLQLGRTALVTPGVGHASQSSRTSAGRAALLPGALLLAAAVACCPASPPPTRPPSRSTPCAPAGTRTSPASRPSAVSAADFGQLFSTTVNGQVYAQPIVVAGTVIAVTENNWVYGLNAATGAITWSRSVGPAWPASAIGCGDLVPNIGITSTPVYDPATSAVYFTAKVNDGPDADHPHFYLHAINPATGVERSGWPVTIQGSPSNDPANTFNPKTAAQRPGLLLLDGVVYAGFASHCDYGPYVGYVAGVRTTTPADDDAVVHRGRSLQRHGRHLAVRRRPGLRRPRPDLRGHRQRRLARARPGHQPARHAGRVGDPAAGQRRRHR